MSGYRSYGQQGPPPRTALRRSPFLMDDEDDEEYDHPSYLGHENMTAFMSSYQQSNEDLLRRRSVPISPGNRLYPNQSSYDNYEHYEDRDHYESESTIAAEGRHYSNSVLPPPDTSAHFSAQEDDGDNRFNNTSPSPPATSIESSDSVQTPRRQSKNGRSTRSSISTFVTESLRRASQAVDTIVKSNFGTKAAEYWSFLTEDWLRGLIFSATATVVIAGSMYYADLHPDDEVGYAAFVRELGRLPEHLAHAFRQGQRLAALKAQAKFNVTEYLDYGGGFAPAFERGPWRIYGELLRDVEMETWFDEVRAVDDVVSALWAGLPAISGVVVPGTEGNSGQTNGNAGGVVHQPLPITVTVTFPGSGGGKVLKEHTARKSDETKKKKKGEKHGGDNEEDENTKAVMRRLKIRSAIDMRSTMRKRAEAYFENFLAGRAVVIGQALEDSRRFSELVESHVVSEEGSPPSTKKVGPAFYSDVAAKFGPPVSSTKKAQKNKDEFPEVNVFNRTNYILSYAGLHLTDRLLETHQSLYAAARPEPADLPDDLKGKTSSIFGASEPNTLGALADLRRARDAEMDILQDLVAQSAYGPIIADPALLPLSASSSSAAINRLIDKLEGLERTLQSVGRNLAWVNERFASQVTAERGKQFRPKPPAGSVTGTSADMDELEHADEIDMVRYVPLVWSQSAAELVESWGRVLDGTAEARGWAVEHERELARKRRGEDGSDATKGSAVQRWRVGNCAGASCYGDILANSPAAIGSGGKGEEKKKKKSKGWFWQKSEEEKTERQRQTPLSGSADQEKVEKGDNKEDTPERRATREKLCCGYSMHNEWADILMYGDKQFTYQDLYSGHQEGALV
ncbi:hypothetical protein PG989_012787 [Apiospora arundinis]